MAHYAQLDENNIVISVIVGKDDTNDIYYWERYYTEQTGKVFKKTSYNTVGNYHRLGGIPFRKNYAGIGYSYDADKDAFIPPKPHESWVLNEDTCLWEPPIEPPDQDKIYTWNEDTLSWI